MTAEAIYLQEDDELNLVGDAALAAGEVIQLPDGRAAVRAGKNAAAAGDTSALYTRRQFTVAKAVGMVFIAGQEVWWDHSANSCKFQPANDRDFPLGMVVNDAVAADTTCVVALNQKPAYIIDIAGGGYAGAFEHVPVLTAGTPILRRLGGGHAALFSATAEAQKLDLLSKRSFPIGAKWILEAVVEVDANADADVADLNVGVANATHASDADSITESCFFHFDMGADLNLDAESDDGTTEVTATDTTVDWAEGTPIHLLIDGRDHTNIKMYVNGARVLSATTFTLEDATGPLKALFHLEKSANDSPGQVHLDMLRVRIMEQAV